MLVCWHSVDWLVKRTHDVLTWWNSLSKASSRLLSSRKVSPVEKVFTMSPNVCLGCLRSIQAARLPLDHAKWQCRPEGPTEAERATCLSPVPGWSFRWNGSRGCALRACPLATFWPRLRRSRTGAARTQKFHVSATPYCRAARLYSGMIV